MRTPQSILDEDQRDVFEEIFGEAPEEFRENIIQSMWSAYRFVGLGNSNVDYWVTCMTDRYNLISRQYLEAFNVYKTYLEGAYDDLNAGSSEVQYIHEDTPDTAIGTPSPYMSTRDTTKTRVYQDLPQTTLKQALQDLTDPYSMFVREFSELFLRRLF